MSMPQTLTRPPLLRKRLKHSSGIVSLAAADVEHVRVIPRTAAGSLRHRVAQDIIIPQIQKRSPRVHHALIVAVALGFGLLGAQQVYITLSCKVIAVPRGAAQGLVRPLQRLAADGAGQFRHMGSPPYHCAPFFLICP